MKNHRPDQRVNPVHIEVKTEIDRKLSLDPSYIVRYQLFEDGSFIGDGVVQYQREAAHNDFAIPAWIKKTDGSPLPEEVLKNIKREIAQAAVQYINQRRQPEKQY
ncbi:hypothetical protein Psfp_01763 [Pelotomaculum sp. FP]|nr:hypothetical protein Psfp_01763 [Pelotomaculum sp. FP]